MFIVDFDVSEQEKALEHEVLNISDVIDMDISQIPPKVPDVDKTFLSNEDPSMIVDGTVALHVNNQEQQTPSNDTDELADIVQPNDASDVIDTINDDDGLAAPISLDTDELDDIAQADDDNGLADGHTEPISLDTDELDDIAQADDDEGLADGISGPISLDTDELDDIAQADDDDELADGLADRIFGPISLDTDELDDIAQTDDDDELADGLTESVSLDTDELDDIAQADDGDEITDGLAESVSLDTDELNDIAQADDDDGLADRIFGPISLDTDELDDIAQADDDDGFADGISAPVSLDTDELDDIAQADDGDEITDGLAESVSLDTDELNDIAQADDDDGLADGLTEPVSLDTDELDDIAQADVNDEIADGLAGPVSLDPDELDDIAPSSIEPNQKNNTNLSKKQDTPKEKTNFIGAYFENKKKGISLEKTMYVQQTPLYSQTNNSNNNLYKSIENPDNDGNSIDDDTGDINELSKPVSPDTDDSVPTDSIILNTYEINDITSVQYEDSFENALDETISLEENEPNAPLVSNNILSNDEEEYDTESLPIQEDDYPILDDNIIQKRPLTDFVSPTDTFSVEPPLSNTPQYELSKLSLSKKYSVDLDAQSIIIKLKLLHKNIHQSYFLFKNILKK